MKPRHVALLGCVLAAATALWWWTRDGAAPPDAAFLRAAPGLPARTTGQRVRYFYDVMRAGESVSLGGKPVPIWREVGERQLIALGQPALDFLLAPERYAEFRSAPNHLVTVLRILPSFAGAREHPGLYPFFAHWLDEKNCPRKTPRANWPAEIRLRVFGAMKELPGPAAVPHALAEFDREERVHDLRGAAVSVLLESGHGEKVLGLYERLPDANDPDFRTQLIVLLRAMAAPGRPPEELRQVKALRPLLEREAKSEVSARRLNAQAALLRLGDATMEQALLAEFERQRVSDPKSAWTALQLLTRDRPHPRVRELAVEAVEKGEGDLAFMAGAKFLAAWWRDDPEIKARMWQLVSDRKVPPLMLVKHLAHADRARTVEWIEDELATGEWPRIQEAVRLVVGAPFPEVGPRLLEMVRAAPPDQRPFLYRSLASLETPGTEALLVAELRTETSPHLQDAAVTELLNLGGADGLALLARRLDEGDFFVLDALLRRTRALGVDGVPEALLPGVLRALRNQPSEAGRRIALYVLRFRGTLKGVRDPLVDAFRREPSRRVAAEMRLVITELGYRE